MKKLHIESLYSVVEQEFSNLKSIGPFLIDIGQPIPDLTKSRKEVDQNNIIKSISYDQIEIIQNILHLYTGDIELDPTYSKGNFYKSGKIKQPKYKYDLIPASCDVLQANANNLPFADSTTQTIMFDPPFLVGYKKDTPTGIIGKRFSGFQNIKALWKWYDECLVEFYRILKPDGYLIVKCMDTVSSGKQWLSHVHIVNEAEKLGFYTEELFVLCAKNRIKGHNHTVQKHARKYHSYFLVFHKPKSNKRKRKSSYTLNELISELAPQSSHSVKPYG